MVLDALGDAVGVVPVVDFEHVQAGGRRQMQEVYSGGSYYSQSDLALHFGLGEAQAIEKLEARWPAGGVQVWESLGAKQECTFTEGRQEFRKTPYRKP